MTQYEGTRFATWEKIFSDECRLKRARLMMNGLTAETTTSQAMLAHALLILRSLGPDNIAMPFDKQRRIDEYFNKMTEPGFSKLLNWWYPIQYDNSGTKLDDHRDLDIFPHNDFNELCSLAPGQTQQAMAEFMDDFRKDMKPNEAETRGEDAWYEDLKIICKALSYAVMIETRKTAVMAFGTNMTVDKHRYRIGKTAPHMYDLASLHPLVAKACPPQMKGVGSVVKDYFRVEDTAKFRGKEAVLKKLHGVISNKIGSALTKLVLESSQRTAAFRQVSKIATAIINKTNFLQFMDLPVLRDMILSGKLKLLNYNSCIPGFAIENPNCAVKISFACMTAGIYMPTEFNELSHRSALEYCTGKVQTRPTSEFEFAKRVPNVYQSESGNTNDTTGQNCGYNPSGGTNSEADVMLNAQKYLEKAVSFVDEPRNVASSIHQMFAEKRDAAAKPGANDIKYFDYGTSHVREFASSWVDFFLTVNEEERREGQERAKRMSRELGNDRDRSGIPNKARRLTGRRSGENFEETLLDSIPEENPSPASTPKATSSRIAPSPRPYNLQEQRPGKDVGRPPTRRHKTPPSKVASPVSDDVHQALAKLQKTLEKQNESMEVETESTLQDPGSSNV